MLIILFGRCLRTNSISVDYIKNRTDVRFTPLHVFFLNRNSCLFIASCSELCFRFSLKSSNYESLTVNSCVLVAITCQYRRKRGPGLRVDMSAEASHIRMWLDWRVQIRVCMQLSHVNKGDEKTSSQRWVGGKTRFAIIRDWVSCALGAYVPELGCHPTSCGVFGSGLTSNYSVLLCFLSSISLLCMLPLNS